MCRVAIYCRLSVEDKDKRCADDESESIQNQETLLTKYALDKKWIIYDIYKDEDYSGIDSDRPDFNRLIKDAEARKFDIVLCKTQSRFTRDMQYVEKYIHTKFIEWQIRFITLLDGADTSDKHNKKSRQINGLINEWYSEDTSENIKAVFRLKQNTGKFIGSFPSYGYKKDPNDKNKLIVDEEAAAVVRLIYSLYLQGYGVQRIASNLNEKGILNPSTYKKSKGLKYKNSSAKDNYGLWTKITVKRILKNEIYTGTMVQNKRNKLSYKSKKIIEVSSDKWVRVKGTHCPIISEDTFNKVQQRFSSNVRSSGEGKTHIFAGKVRCMTCGSIMIKSGNGEGYKYLKCKLSTVSKSRNLCTSHSIRLDKLEEIITEKVKQHINELCNINNILKELSESSNKPTKLELLKQQLIKIEKDITLRDQALKNLYLDKVSGLISTKQFEDFNNIFTNEKNKLLLNKTNILKLLENTSEKEELQNRMSIVNKYKDIKKLNHYIVNKLIDVIEIGEENSETRIQEVKIFWNF